MRRMRNASFIGKTSALGLGVAILAACVSSGEAIGGGTASGTNGPPAPMISGTMPTAIPPHDTSLSPENARPFFDTFSWQAFTAAMWPVDPASRGAPLTPTQPATLTGAGNSYATVWGSYLTVDDLFPGGTARPLAWTAPDPSIACTQAGPGDKVLAMNTKSNSLLSQVDEAFSYPLIDQNNNYIYYEVAYNQMQYDFVRGSDSDPTSWLYLARNLAQAEMKAPIWMPVSVPSTGTQGAIMVKAAWKQMTASDTAGRYFVVDAYVVTDATTSPVTCEKKTMGLIGLHIAAKIDGFDQWIWSTFEQVDNVPPDTGAPPHTPMTLNNGTTTPATTGGWANQPTSTQMQPPSQRSPTQVTRFNPIPATPAGASTLDVNAAWQTALAGTPLQFYQLVITQWPTDESTFKILENGGLYPAGAGQPFPVAGAVNTAMETYFQSPGDAAGAGGNSCMQCHYTAGKADFSWTLTLRSY